MTSSVLGKVNRSGADLVYYNESDEIIITKVNYDQCNTLGSDTSWCLIGSPGTFKNYTTKDKSQYIIFLTDENGKWSKIGVTYGFKFRTAHLKDDSYLSEDKLKQLLEDRGTSYKILEADRESFIESDKFLSQKISDLKDWGFSEDQIKIFKKRFFEEGRYKFLTIHNMEEIGFTQEEIINHIEIFTKKQLDGINNDLIKKYDLVNRVEIDREDIKEIDNIQWIIDRLDRINFKLNVNHILQTHPMPSQLDKIDLVYFDKGAKEWLNNLRKYKGTIDEHISKFNSYYYDTESEKWDGSKYTKVTSRNEKKNSLESVIYALKYCGFHDGNYSIKDAVRLPIGGYASEMREWVYFLKSSGFYDIEDNYDYMSKIASRFVNTSSSFNTFATEVSDWFKLLNVFPILKPKIRDILEENENKKHMNNSFFYESTLNQIKEEFPDLYPSIFKRYILSETYTSYVNTIPNPGNSENWGLDRKGDYKSREKGISDIPKEYYDRFWGILKDYEWRFGDNSTTLSGIYMILILCKTGHFDEIPKMKTKWTPPAIGKIIRAAFDIWGSNTQYFGDKTIRGEDKWSIIDNPNREKVESTNIHPNFKLNDNERIKLFETLLRDVKVETEYVDTEGVDLDQVRHKSFSVIYYVYNWGFNQYVRRVEKLKGTLRIREFEYIFSYLAKKGKISEIKDIMDDVLSWEMGKEEMKKTLEYIKMAGHWSDFGKKGKEEYESVILPKYNISPYKSKSNW